MTTEIIQKEIILTADEKRLLRDVKTLPMSVFNRLSDNKISDFSLRIVGTQSLIIARRKFFELDEILMTGAYCLREGCRFDHQVVKESNGVVIHDKEAQYAMNFHNLKSAVVWYVSSIDYIQQIIYFGFEFNEPFYDEFGYKKELKNKYFYKTFLCLTELDDTVKTLYENWKAFRGKLSIKSIRELANALKHHGGFELTEIKKGERRVTTTENCTKRPIEWWRVLGRPEIRYVDLVEMLKDAHMEIAQFEEYLFEELGLSKISSRITLTGCKIKPRFSVRELKERFSIS